MKRFAKGEAAAVFFGGTVPQPKREAKKVCVLCREPMSNLNRHGECEECVDHAESGWGF